MRSGSLCRVYIQRTLSGVLCCVAGVHIYTHSHTHKTDKTKTTTNNNNLKWLEVPKNASPGKWESGIHCAKDRRKFASSPTSLTNLASAPALDRKKPFGVYL
jgi:hypothetical protein